MSFVVLSVTPPTKITGCAAVGDRFVLTRGNEVVVARASETEVTVEQVFEVFGRVSDVAAVGDLVFVLLESEVLVCFRLVGDTLTCTYRCNVGTKIGKRIDESWLNVSARLLVGSTRVRTLFILDIETRMWFHAMLPFEIVYDVRCVSSDNVMVLGKAFKGGLELDVLRVDWENRGLVRTNRFHVADDVGQERSFAVGEDGVFAVSVDQTVTVFDGQYQVVRKQESRNVKIRLAFIDSVLYECHGSGVSNADDGWKIIDMSDTKRLVSIGKSLYVQMSAQGDAHIVRICDGKFEALGSYVQLNATALLGRSQFVTKAGRLRTVVNGSATSLQVSVDIAGGTRMWILSDDMIVVSTFSRTIVMTHCFVIAESWLARDERSLFVGVECDSMLQITEKGMFMNGIGVVEFENEAVVACASSGIAAVAMTNGEVLVFSWSVDGVVFQRVIPVGAEVSAITVAGDRVAVSYWRESVVKAYSLSNGNEIDSITVDTLLVSSLLYSDTGALMIGGCGKVFVDGEAIPVSNGAVQLRKISGNVMAVSDMCSRIVDGKAIPFDVPSAAVDGAAYDDNRMALLTDKSIQVVAVQGEYPMHVEDLYAMDRSLVMMAVDEEGKFPVVLAAKRGDFYYLMPLHMPSQTFEVREVPVAMLWITYKGDKLLVVGCSVGSNGRVIIYDSSMKRRSFINVDHPVDAIAYVNHEYIAVALADRILLLGLDEEEIDYEMKILSSAATRVKCASLTSPNSCAIVYADVYASVIVFTAIDGKIEEVSRDYNPKGLSFARLESETDILAIGRDSAIYNLSLDTNGELSTRAAFNIGASCSAILNNPDLSFVSDSGAMCVIFKGDPDLTRIFSAMQTRIRDVAGLTISDYRNVYRNNKAYSFGPFVDGDLLLRLPTLSATEIKAIAYVCRSEVTEIHRHISLLSARLSSYRQAAYSRALITVK